MATLRLPNGGWTPRPHQLKLWTYLEQGGKRAIEIAHRRWGKDEIALHRTAIAAHERVGSYWHMLPEYAQARKAIWASVNPHTGKRRIDEAFPQELRANTNEHEMFIRFKNGSTWQVVGSDSYDSLVGSSVCGVVFSEFALANPSAWAFLAPILAENGGWAVLITTPRGRNHAKAMLDMAQKNPAWFSEVSSVLDTKAISLESVEAQRAEYHALYGADAGDALIDQEYFVSFDAAILGSYWGKEMTQALAQKRIGVVDYEPALPVHTAWDIGVGDDTAIWCFQEHFNQIRVIDYYEASGYGVRHYVDWLESKPYHYGNDYVPHDAKVREWTSEGPDGLAKTRVQTMLELKRRPVVVSQAKLDDSINAGRRVIPYAVFDEVRCAKGLECLRQYRREWDDKLKVFRDVPVHDWASHGASAWRYLSMSVRNIKRPPVELPKPTPKGIMDMTWNQAIKAGSPKRSARV